MQSISGFVMWRQRAAVAAREAEVAGPVRPADAGESGNERGA